MANLKITELVADASPSSDDLILTVNSPGSSPTNKKVTIANLATVIATLNGLNITAGRTLTVQDNVVITGSLGSAAYTASTAYEASGGIATHAALLTGIHGLVITAGKTLTVQDNVTITGALGTGAYATIANYAPLASPTFTGVVSIPDGSQANPSLAFATDPDTGFWLSWPGILTVVAAGARVLSMSGYLYIDGNGLILRNVAGSPATGAMLTADADYILAQRTGANVQTLRIYTSYTDGSNYERFAINTAAGTITLAAETLGTGTDNIDLALTPGGTGNVKFGSYTAGAATDSTGYITIKDADGNLRKLMVQA